MAGLLPLAKQQDRKLEDLIQEALQQYIWESRERQIDREMQAYRALHLELKQHYLGEYVAIYNGKLVDHDVDRRTLSQRVHQRYADAVVLITPVEPQPDREFLLTSPRFERGG
jgi:hypothetical protein